MMKKARLFQVAVLMATLFFVSIQGHAQNVTVRGTVTDEAGAPLIGVNVWVEGTSIGTATGVGGSYQLSVAPNAEITYGFVGYVTQVIPVDGRTTINVSLAADAQLIDDVVVIGYGVTTKRDLTGAVTQVKAEELMATSPTSIQEALRGKAAGVVVTGDGMNPQIRIRGNRSMGASNDPLFVVDGIPQVGGLDLINPNDVESMEILKDASATAIYGSRGANGVILVTTKQGEKGRVTVTYDGYLSITSPNRWRRIQNAEEYMEFNREADRQYIYDGQGGYRIDPENSVYPSETPNMDADFLLANVSGDPYSVESLRPAWANGVYDPSKIRAYNWQEANWNDSWYSHNHNLSIRGGGQNTIVALSGNFMDNQARTKGEEMKRYMLNLNLEQTVNKAITVGARAGFSYMERVPGFGVGGIFNPLRSPFYSPKKADGTYDYTQPGDIANGIILMPDPLSYNPFLNQEGHREQSKNNRVSASLYARIQPLPGLTYYITYGTNLRIGQRGTFDSRYSTAAATGDPRASVDVDINRDWNFTHTLTYAKKIGDHDFSIMAAQDAFKSIDEELNGDALGLPLESQLWHNLDAAATQNVETSYTQRTLLSYFGRAHYGYKGKYLLDFTYRYDGASVLAEGHKWSGFPAAAFAWRIIEEPFMQSQSLFSNLKLRVGYGQSGQQSVSPYSTVGQIDDRRYTWGTVGTIGYVPSSLSNPSLVWERSTTLSFGVDFAMLQGRLSGTLDLYYTQTTDIILQRLLPWASGFDRIRQNIGESANRGIELGLSSINIQKPQFSWTTDFTISYNKEEIVSLYSGMDRDLGNSWFVGHPINTYYYLEGTERLWGYSAEDMAEMAKFNANGHDYRPGQYRYVDQNGDYKIDLENDRVFRGQKMPKTAGSLSNTFRYKFNNGSQLDLFVFAYGAAGFTVYRHRDEGGAMGRYNKLAVDYWTPRNPDGIFIKPVQGLDVGTQGERQGVAYWKGDYIKISDITLGYSLPQSLLKKVGINSLRVYAKARNPFSPITSYPFNDPEGAANPNNQGNFGVEYGDPDTFKSFQFGVQLSF